MIRILHSVSNMDRAGIETMLMNYYRHIDRNEIQFDFLCNKKKPGAYDNEILEMGGKIYHSPGVNPIRFFHYQKYMKQLFDDHPEYKVLHCHNGAFGVYALHASKKNNIPVRIYHCHGASLIKDLKYPLKRFCMLFLKSNITDIWTCSTDAAKFYFGVDVVQKKLYKTITNAIEAENFLFNEEIRTRIRKENNLEDCIVLGHVGRFMTQKNHTFLLDVFYEFHKEHANARLVLLGDGELSDEIKNKVMVMNLNDSVIFTGNVPNTYEWYQAFDVFLLPSLYEGLPVVGIEAQAADLPCIFSSEVTREVKINDNVDFMSLSISAKEWSLRIEFVLQQHRKRQNRLKEITAAGYNIKIEAGKLETMYKNMVNKTIFVSDK